MNQILFDFYKLNCGKQIETTFFRLSESSFQHSILKKINKLNIEDIVPSYISSYAHKLAKYANVYVIGRKGIKDFNAKTDEIIGLIAFYTNNIQSRHGFISIIIVEKNQQGQGFGRALVELAKENAIASGMCTLGINVHKENDNAQKFYRKMGFTIRKELNTEFELEMLLQQHNGQQT